MANCSSRKKGETEQEYRKRCGGYTYAFPIDLVQKKEPSEPPTPKEPATEPPAPEGDDVSVNESININMLLASGIALGAYYILPLIFRGIQRTYYDIKNIVSPEDYIIFVKKLEKNDEFNKQIIDLLKEKFNKIPLSKFIMAVMNLPAFTNEFNKFIKDKGINDSKDIQKLKNSISIGMVDAFGDTPKHIYKFLKKKYPELTKDLGESIYKFEARHTKGNIYKGKLKIDGNPVQVEVELVGVDNRTRSYLVRVIHIDRKYLSYLPKTGIIPIPARIFDIPGGGWVKVNTRGQFEGKLTEMSMVDLVDIDKFADKELNPINVVLTGKHFFDRLQDPRNRQEITSAELIGFFKRLSKNKIKFLEFLKKYDEIVVKDNRTKINIPFMIKANDAIAKTIMRKSNFATPSPEYTFETIKKVDGKWVVYPKSGGDRLGTHTTYKDALKQLQAIEASKARNEDAFPGGLADKYSLGDLAKKHGVGVDEIKSQIAKGMKVEMEHTNDKKVAFEIAKDHIFEDPKYYDKLKTIENRIYELLKKKLREDWTNKYKKSIDCNNPKGFSQKAHCDGREARRRGEKTKSNPVK